MVKRHKYDKGVDCAVCKAIVYKPNYIRVQLHKPLEDSTGRTKILKSFCLCQSCYSKKVLPFLEEIQ